MEAVIYEKLGSDDITPALFEGFSRHQEVKRCWRKENSAWVLKDIAFLEEWEQKDFEHLAVELRSILHGGGVVLAAFCGNRLAGFASLDNEPFGSGRQYLNLSNLHVSHEHRGRGIGKMLLLMIGSEAKKLHAQKLYISAHSSQESQAFYRAMGCVEALEYNLYLAEKEPCDCQMELVL